MEQGGLADAEGGVFVFPRRIVAERDGNRACGGGITRWSGALRTGVQASIKQRMDEDNWIGFSGLALEATVADRQGRQGNGLRDKRPS